MLSYHHLVDDTMKLARKLPADLCAIAGVPRKGMLPATILAERLHLPLLSATEYLTNNGQLSRWDPIGEHGPAFGHRYPLSAGKGNTILLVDDSVGSEAVSLRTAAQRMRDVGSHTILTAAVWVPEPIPVGVDFWGETFSQSEFQEPEFLNTFSAEHYATDLDGVLCEDPPDGETDEEARWRKIFDSAVPMYLPRFKAVAAIVTSRLEKYRGVTEAWLARWGVKYRQLIMHPAANCRERGSHADIARWKASQVIAVRCNVYIESNPAEAIAIQRLIPGRPVYCSTLCSWAADIRQRLKIFLGMPHSGNPVMAASKALWTAKSERADVFPFSHQTSALCRNFNILWSQALNLYEQGKITHFAMLHDDCVPQMLDGEPGNVLDVMLAELERTGADLIASCPAIKDDRGLTSTAIEDPLAGPWDVAKRLTLAELHALPETFDAADCGYPGRAILANTGFWLCDLRKPIFHESGPVYRFFFTMRDQIVRHPQSKEWVTRFQSEDWLFSSLLQEAGARVVCTRKVKIGHVGPDVWSNDAPWGKLKEDPCGTVAALKELAKRHQAAQDATQEANAVMDTLNSP